MDDPRQRLMRLAAAAVRHAQQDHNIELSPDRLDPIDVILQRMRVAAPASGPPSTAESGAEAGGNEPTAPELAAGYGAWLGYWAVTACGGEWVGLHEPCAPRVRVGGELFSPVDAVRRVLDGNPSAIPIVTVAAQMRRAADDANSSRETSLPRNRKAWDHLAGDPRFAGVGTLPDSPERALAAIDPWVRGSGVVGRDVLCLAAGGGTHGPLYAIAGARVTVVDISSRQLEHDDAVAQKLQLPIRNVCQSIDRLQALHDASFDVVVQPVSSSYVPDVRAVYREVARVIRRGGVYVSQHKQPVALQSIASSCRDEASVGNQVAAGPLRLWTPAVDGRPVSGVPAMDASGPIPGNATGSRQPTPREHARCDPRRGNGRIRAHARRIDWWAVRRRVRDHRFSRTPTRRRDGARGNPRKPRPVRPAVPKNPSRAPKLASQAFPHHRKAAHPVRSLPPPKRNGASRPVPRLGAAAGAMDSRHLPSLRDLPTAREYPSLGLTSKAIACHRFAIEKSLESPRDPPRSRSAIPPVVSSRGATLAASPGRESGVPGDIITPVAERRQALDTDSALATLGK